MQLEFFFLLGAGLGLVAAVMAYLITYNEYQHHFTGRRVFRESLKSAIITFCFFLLLSFMLGLCFKN